jgi:hypothetical protein
MKPVILSKVLSAVVIAAAFAGVGAVPASTQALAQAATKEGSLLPHYFDKNGDIKWGGWGPPAAEHQAAAPSRTLYLYAKPHAHRSHVRAH